MFKRCTVQLTERIQRTNIDITKKNIRQETKKLKDHLVSQHTSENSILLLNFTNTSFDDIKINGIVQTKLNF